MFSKSVIESDSFMDMPAEAQMLYVHLCMASDDDGFCDNPRSIMRQCGSGNDAMKILIAKKFVLSFDRNDGFIAVIKHWRLNNYIRRDTYHETKYKEFMRELYYDENQSYSMNSGDGHVPCIPAHATNPSQSRDEPVTDTGRTRDEPLTQDRLGKDRLVKVSLDQIREGDKGEPFDSLPDEMKKICEKYQKDISREIRNGNKYNLISLYTAQAYGEGIEITVEGESILFREI